ncbi:MAG: DNA polymerase III subunit delta [Rikenellaceae bacterium]
MQFSQIIGQDKIKEHLIAGAQRGRVPHAQLFAGELGFGGLPLALAYITYLNCTNRSDKDSCGECPSCVQMRSCAHPDVHYVFPVNTPKGKSSSTKPLSDHYLAQWREQVTSTKGYFTEQEWYKTLDIENKEGNISTFEADEIIRKLSFKSYESEFKVVLMFLPERMNRQAANKLLKIIEEPWDKSLFIMVGLSASMLLETISSRLQSLSIPPIESQPLLAELIEGGISKDAAERLSRMSRGNYLDALRLYEQRDVVSDEFDFFVKLMRLSYENKHLELMELAEAVASLGREQQKFLINNSIRLLRDSYMINAGLENLCRLTDAEYSFCKKFAPFVNNKNIEFLVDQMELLIRDISSNANARIAFTHFVLMVSKQIVAL